MVPVTSGEAFSFILQPTYFQTGFFNVGADAQMYLGADGEKIELFLGNAQHPVIGTIDRTAHKNRTPRVMGGSALRIWFQTHAHEMERISVQVFSPISIRLIAAGSGPSDG